VSISTKEESEVEKIHGGTEARAVGGGWRAGRRSPIGLVALSVLALVLVACGPRGGTDADGASEPAAVESLAAPESEVTLQFWTPFTGPDGPFMETLVDQFNEEGSTVTVEMSIVPEYYTELRTAAEGGSLPQVGIMHLDAIPQNAEDQIISPLGDLVELLGLDESDFTEAVWANTTWKDEQYGIPLDIHPFVMYWNKALFEEAGLDPDSPPNSQEEFEAAMQALQDAGATGPIWSNHGFSAGMAWASFFYQGGGEWTNADFSEATFNSEAGVQAGEWMKSLVDQGFQPANVEPDAELPAFLEGNSGIVFAGPWQLSRLAEGIGEDLGAGPMPQIFGEGVWAGSHNLAVFDGISDEERQAAYYFIDWITANATEWAKAGQVPARLSVRDSEEFQALDHIPVIADQVDDARFFPPFPASADLLFGAGGASEQVVAALVGDKEVQAGLDEGAERFTQIIQETKEDYDY
jgi:multiple sugar transport system substrate-binding protein